MSENLDLVRSIYEEPIKLEPYDPAWPLRFEEERAALQAAIGDWIVGGVPHVGSTAVPGLEAKPIIDILVGVQDLETSRACFDSSLLWDMSTPRIEPRRCIGSASPAHVVVRTTCIS